MRSVSNLLLSFVMLASLQPSAFAGDDKAVAEQRPLPVRMSFVPASAATPTTSMTITPTTLAVTVLQNAPLPPAMYFSISSDASSTLNWNLVDNMAWMDETPTSGVTSFQSVQTQINQTSLPAGTYFGTITISSPDAINSPQSIAVIYTISCCVLEGDWNHDGTVNVVDLTRIVIYLFQFGPQYVCKEEADVNDNSVVNIVDLSRLVAYIFSGTPLGSCP